MKFPFAFTLGRRAILTALSLLVLGVAIGACGSSDPSSTSSSGSSASNSSDPSGGARYQARLNLAKCLRQHGINVPDPSPGGGVPSSAFRDLRSYPQAQTQAALQACHQYLAQAFPQLSLSPAQRAQFQQEAVRFAECMRSHGVNLPDPTFNGNGGFGFRQALGSIDRNSPTFQSALSACQSLRPKFGRGAGAATGGGSGA